MMTDRAIIKFVAALQSCRVRLIRVTPPIRNCSVHLVRINPDLWHADTGVPGLARVQNCVVREPVQSHETMVAPPHPPGYCVECGSNFGTRLGLKNHAMVHTDTRPFTCRFCPATFKYRGNHRSHENRHDPVNRKFECLDCGRKFFDKKYLNEHRTRHTGVKNFQCITCYKAFSTAGGLRKHKIIHTDHWPFGCDQCARVFRTPGARKQHQSVHSDQRPHQCTMCPKSFKRDAYRLLHLKCFHNNEKPYECTFCSRGFAKDYNRSQHEVICPAKSNSGV